MKCLLLGFLAHQFNLTGQSHKLSFASLTLHGLFFVQIPHGNPFQEPDIQHNGTHVMMLCSSVPVVSVEPESASHSDDG